MKDQVEALVFDQYGTIVDMQAGLTAVAAPFHGFASKIETLLRRYTTGRTDDQPILRDLPIGK